MQISRFYEVMCVQHQWLVEDWQQYLQSHPIMGRFIQRLVWLELDSNGQIVNSFRPIEDGNLITNQDEEISLDQHHFITVAHSVLLSSEDIAQWQSHLKDYKVISWFDQLSHPLPDMNKFRNDIINDRHGWSMDSFTVRDILTELGYERESAQEDEYFFCYHKYYSRLKIYIHIDFSGGMVPEENILAVLDRLYFSKTPGYQDDVVKLDNLPKVLLAESYANYMAVADASNGFDPNWRNKVIWDT